MESGRPDGEEGAAEEIRTLDLRIREHGSKILTERARPEPDRGRIRHWEAEIQAFRDGIERARKRLGEEK